MNAAHRDYSNPFPPSFPLPLTLCTILPFLSGIVGGGGSRGREPGRITVSLALCPISLSGTGRGGEEGYGARGKRDFPCERSGGGDPEVSIDRNVRWFPSKSRRINFDIIHPSSVIPLTLQYWP